LIEPLGRGRWRSVPLLPLIAAVVLGITSCGDEETPPDPPSETPVVDLSEAMVGDNLLLVSFDTTRADRLGCYGFEAAITPSIDGSAMKAWHRCRWLLNRRNKRVRCGSFGKKAV